MAIKNSLQKKGVDLYLNSGLKEPYEALVFSLKITGVEDFDTADDYSRVLCIEGIERGLPDKGIILEKGVIPVSRDSLSGMLSTGYGIWLKPETEINLNQVIGRLEDHILKTRKLPKAWVTIYVRPVEDPITYFRGVQAR